MLTPYFKSNDTNFNLILGDTFEVLNTFDFKFDVVFADPPYFLSNDGLTIKNGKIASVNKGKWDKSLSYDEVNKFNYKWLKLIRKNMKDDATIWISGTKHNIFSLGQTLNELNYKILNIITWEKTNPPPNFSKKYFNFSTEFIIWAKKSSTSNHYLNSELMKKIDDNKQMKDIWRLPSVSYYEKKFGKHPTQKPLALLSRIVLATSLPNSWILDPFTGSSTTGIAANLYNRRFVGIDNEIEFLELSIKRKIQIEDIFVSNSFRNNINLPFE